MHPTEFNHLDHPSYLFVQTFDSEDCAFALDIDNSLFLGSGGHCGVILPDEDAESTHCMFWINEQNVLRVQDWDTSGRTLVNGQPVCSEVILKSGDELKIGNTKIMPVLDRQMHQKIVGQLSTQRFMTSPKPNKEATMPAETSQTHSEPETNSETKQRVADDECKIDSDEKMANLESDSQHPSEDLLADDSQQAFSQTDEGIEFGYEVISFGKEEDNQGPTDPNEAERLQLEVDQLRQQITDQESQFDGVGDSQHHSQFETVENDDTIQLVNRLEELLEELSNSDDRVRGLEELLRVSDNATQAERDERQQLESWVSEIEQRVEQKEAESAAEMGRLESRLSDTREQLKVAHTQLKSALQSTTGSTNSHADELALELRQQIEQLQEQLESARIENERLCKASPVNTGDDVHEELLRTKEELLQAKVDSSREQAELSRQRVELEQLKGELDEKLKNAKKLGNGDTRLKAMRQHLREIHEEEKIEREERRQKSLSGRISRLLQRVN